MKYIDIYRESYSLAKHPKCSLYFKNLGIRVLAWTSNHEHAVFFLDDEVHPAAVCVWFQDYRGMAFTIRKIHLKNGRWEEAEVSVGSIPLANNNPFDPREQNAASNTAESVFPQNQ